MKVSRGSQTSPHLFQSSKIDQSARISKIARDAQQKTYISQLKGIHESAERRADRPQLVFFIPDMDVSKRGGGEGHVKQRSEFVSCGTENVRARYSTARSEPWSWMKIPAADDRHRIGEANRFRCLNFDLRFMARRIEDSWQEERQNIGCRLL